MYVRHNLKTNAHIILGEDIKTPKKTETQYETEKMETGKVKLEVYLYYVKNMGWCLFGACVSMFTLYQLFSTGSSIWLSIWSNKAENATLPETDTVPDTEDTR